MRLCSMASMRTNLASWSGGLRWTVSGETFLGAYRGRSWSKKQSRAISWSRAFAMSYSSFPRGV